MARSDGNDVQARPAWCLSETLRPARDTCDCTVRPSASRSIKRCTTASRSATCRVGRIAHSRPFAPPYAGASRRGQARVLADGSRRTTRGHGRVGRQPPGGMFARCMRALPSGHLSRLVLSSPPPAWSRCGTCPASSRDSLSPPAPSHSALRRPAVRCSTLTHRHHRLPALRMARVNSKGSKLALLCNRTTGELPYHRPPPPRRMEH
jgi:hypothetical protein